MPVLNPFRHTPMPSPDGQVPAGGTGRAALHTHVSTQNVEYLNELCGENVLWINAAKAAELGIADRAMVEIASSRHSGKMRAYVTDLIHPEVCFLLHGFGHQAKRAERSYNKGVSDSPAGKYYDKVGGSPAYHDTLSP
jgi:thiosulfate reductase/polysulfide reductase chain A